MINKMSYKILYSLLPKLMIFFILIKLYNPKCQPNLPFSKDNVCVESCTKEEVNSGLCILENEIIKNQWINNIIYLSGSGYTYINMVTTKNDDLIIIISAYPGSNERLFYGITQEGRGYFIKNNQERYDYSFTLASSTTILRFESETFMVKLKSSSEINEYIMEYGKYPQLLQVYNLNNKEQIKVCIKDFTSVFYDLSVVKQKIGAKLKLELTSTNDNYYIIGLIWEYYYNSIKYQKFSLIKFSISSLNNDINVSPNKNDFSVYDSECLSCYQYYDIICFYKNENKKYTVGAFSYSNLRFLSDDKFQDGNDNEKMFFKCSHFYQEIGAFVYYSNTNPPYAIIEFEKYCSNSQTLSRYYTKLNFEEYLFYYEVILNDIIKVYDKKIFFVAASFNQLELYIISIYNYDQEKIIYKIYKLNSFAYNGYMFYNTIRLQIFNNYLAFSSNGFKNGESCSSLIIFSYPNSADINNKLEQSLLNNNDIKINNINLEIKNLCKIENNVFGHILIGCKIIEIYKNGNGYLSLEDGTEIQKDMILEMNTTLKLVIPKNGNIYSKFSYIIKYACQAKEPEYEEHIKYPIFIGDTGTSNKEENFYESQRKTYLGRYSYYNFSLINELTEEDCDEKCELCYNTNKNKCVTCKYNDFDLLEDYKICNEIIMTTIITTIPENILTTIPENILTTIRKCFNNYTRKYFNNYSRNYFNNYSRKYFNYNTRKYFNNYSRKYFNNYSRKCFNNYSRIK